jgi:hypothetical protein
MRTVAEGNLIKVVYGILALAAVLAVASWYPQFGQSYEVQNQAKLACNEDIKLVRYGGGARDYKQMFQEGATRAGVNLTDKQYEFSVDHNKQDRVWTCDVKIIYPVDVDVWTIGPILGIKPIHIVKRLNVHHEVPESY